MKTLEEVRKLYAEYVDTFRRPDGRLPEMMQLKLEHTGHVVENARLIAAGENFSDKERETSLMAALLHDTGRYEQLKRYNTFKDSDSVDHAVFSHDIVVEKGWTDDPAVLDAVLWHNRRDLPSRMPPLTATAAHTVRDADKLDIFRVIEALLGQGDWRKDTRAFWNLPVKASPNPEVIDCIERGAPVDYNAIVSVPDFILIQIGWMVSGLHFATSRRLCRERGHLEFRRRFLHELTDAPAVDRVCDLAAAKLREPPMGKFHI